MPVNNRMGKWRFLHTATKRRELPILWTNVTIRVDRKPDADDDMLFDSTDMKFYKMEVLLFNLW